MSSLKYLKMSNKSIGVVEKKEKTFYIDKEEILSIINKYHGIKNVITSEKEQGSIFFEFVIERNSSSLIDFLELSKYKNVKYTIV